MKKALLIGSIVLTLGAVTFARGGYGMGGNGGMMGGGCGGYGYMNSNPEAQQTRIRIQEKNLEIRKETVKANPDWKKVEKLNSEIATEQAKLRTEMQKYMRNNY